MKASPFGIRIIATLALALCFGMAGSASAATRWCFDVPSTGQRICLPFGTQEIPIELPPDPGPYQWVDIESFSEDLMRVLGTSETKWVIQDARGERLFLMDFESQVGFDVDQAVGP